MNTLFALIMLRIVFGWIVTLFEIREGFCSGSREQH